MGLNFSIMNYGDLARYFEPSTENEMLLHNALNDAVSKLLLLDDQDSEVSDLESENEELKEYKFMYEGLNK